MHYLREQDMPPGWSWYASPDGYRWRQAGDGYWWLRVATGLWRRADSQAAGDVLGVPVPGAAHPAARADRETQLGYAAEPVIAVSAAPACILPDFADLLAPGPDCCRDCHRDDTALHEGLCRWCWQLQNPRADHKLRKGVR